MLKQASNATGSDPLRQYFDLTAPFFDSSCYPEGKARSIGFLESKAFRRLDCAFQTIAHASTSRRRDDQEWNPFSQRIPLYDLEHLRAASPDSFSRAHDAAIAIAMSVHELFHILLWEPFFCGTETVGGANRFAELSLIFEAFCYWYGEIVFTNQAPLAYPDGRPVFHDGYSPSSPHRHPARIFELEGVSDPDEILEVYVHAFRGYHTKLNAFQSPAGSDHRTTVYSFYRDNYGGVFRHYRRLARIGIFDRFQAEFCRGAEEISTFGRRSLRFDEILREPTSVKRVVDLLGSAAASLSPAQIRRIRTRREIQTRAYFLLADLRIATDGRLVGGRSFEPLSRRAAGALAASLEEALRLLAVLWKRFIATKKASAIRDELARLNERIDAVYREHGHLFVAYKHQVYPTTGAPELCGLLPRADHSRRQLTDALRASRSKYLASGQPTSDGLRALERLESLSSSKTMGTEAKRDFVGAYNRFFKRFMKLSPFVQSFSEGRFRENDFIYL